MQLNNLNMRRNFFPLMLLGILVSACGSSKNVITSRGELDHRLESILDYKRVPGFSVSVFTKDTVLYQNAFGYKDIERELPYTTETVQMVASISKTTIALALMKAQELNLLELDDPINDYLPFEVVNPMYRNAPITIRHLTMHTSSLKYSEVMTDIRVFEAADVELGAFLKNYLSKEGKWYSDSIYHDRAPGELGDYSNVGASLAAYILEVVSQVPFSEFVDRHIFEPMNFTQTGFDPNISTQYYNYVSQNNFERIDLKEGRGLYPAGLLSTNIIELTRMCQMVMDAGRYGDGQVLQPSSIEHMLDTKKLRNSLDDEIERQGIFWVTTRKLLGIPGAMLGHNGGGFGVFTMMFFNPKTGVGYIMLTNTGLTEENHVSLFNIYRNLWLYSEGVL